MKPRPGRPGTHRAAFRDLMALHHRVLVAERTAALRSWLHAVLRTLDAGVDQVSNGYELLWRLAEDGPYDLVVTPARLGGITGVQVIAMARTAGLTTPCVLFPPLGQSGWPVIARKLGATVLVDDPYDASELHRHARALLGRRQPEPAGLDRETRASLRQRLDGAWPLGRTFSIP